MPDSIKSYSLLVFYNFIYRTVYHNMVLPTIEECRSPLLTNHQRQDSDEIEDNESDTTRVAVSAPHEKSVHWVRSRSLSDSSWRSSSPLSSRRTARSSKTFLTWLRWAVIVSLQSIIISIMVWQRVKGGGEMDEELKGKVVETGGDISGLYKTCK